MWFKGIIYMYKSPSGKCYIGQTTRPKFRRNEHLSRAYNGSELPFHKAIRKYGIDSFEYSVLNSAISQDTNTLSKILNNLEQYYIIKFNSKVPTGYNASDGGEGNLGVVLSEQTRINMSKAKKGHKASEETRKKMSIWLIGKKLSKETKDKISKAHIGKSRSGRSCIQFSMEGEFIKEYKKIKLASLETKINKSAISMALSGRRKSAGGYIWKYKEK